MRARDLVGGSKCWLNDWHDFLFLAKLFVNLCLHEGLLLEILKNLFL